MSNPTGQKCKNCKFLQRGNFGTHHCRRFPRQVVRLRGDVIESRYPVTTGPDWCGEWVERDVS